MFYYNPGEDKVHVSIEELRRLIITAQCSLEFLLKEFPGLQVQWTSDMWEFHRAGEQEFYVGPDPTNEVINLVRKHYGSQTQS